MSAYIILLDLPSHNLTIDGTEVEVQGGFRGFHSVPPGKHQISIVGYSGEKVTKELDLASYEVDVRNYKYDTRTFERAAPDKEESYSRLALSPHSADVAGNFLSVVKTGSPKSFPVNFCGFNVTTACQIYRS